MAKGKRKTVPLNLRISQAAILALDGIAKGEFRNSKSNMVEALIQREHLRITTGKTEVAV